MSGNGSPQDEGAEKEREREREREMEKEKQQGRDVKVSCNNTEIVFNYKGGVETKKERANRRQAMGLLRMRVQRRRGSERGRGKRRKRNSKDGTQR